MLYTFLVNIVYIIPALSQISGYAIIQMPEFLNIEYYTNVRITQHKMFLFSTPSPPTQSRCMLVVFPQR